MAKDYTLKRITAPRISTEFGFFGSYWTKVQYLFSFNPSTMTIALSHFRERPILDGLLRRVVEWSQMIKDVFRKEE
jgi:hypothetical protein